MEVVFKIYSLSNLLMERREAIIFLHCVGKSNAAIAKSLCVARSSVKKAIKRFDEKGYFCDCQKSFPDLNSMDFSIWLILEAKPCSKVHCIEKNLKHFLELTLQEISQSQQHGCSSVILSFSISQNSQLD